MTPTDRPVVVVVGQGMPAQGGISTFIHTLVDDPVLGAQFEMQLLNTTRKAIRRAGRPTISTIRWALEDSVRVFRAARRADVVHINTSLLPAFPLLRSFALTSAARLGGAAVLCHAHSEINMTPGPFAPSFLVRTLLGRLTMADRVLTVSEVGRAALEPYVGGVPIEIVDNAIDVDAVAPAVPVNDRPTVVFAGTLSRNKGLVELVTAAGELMQAGVDGWRLEIIGGANEVGEAEAAEIREVAASFGLAECFVGPLPRPELLSRLSNADVFVLPSHSEGQPIAVIEALAAGLPVVATRVGAVPLLVRDEQEGLLVEPRDVAGLRGALARLIRDPALRKRMGNAARQRAEERHGLRRLQTQLSRIYRDAA